MTHKCTPLSIIKPIWFHMHADTSLRSTLDKIQLATSKYVHMRSLCEILFTSILPRLVCFFAAMRRMFASICRRNLLFVCISGLFYSKLFHIKFIELVFGSNFHES